MAGWKEFFEDVLKKTPLNHAHAGLRANVHPDEHGNWVWHISVVKNHEPKKQKEIMLEIIELVGEGEVDTYEGGVIKVLQHATRRLTKEEIDRLPEGSEELTKAFEEKVLGLKRENLN